jgi:uncharacterized protein
MEERSKFDNMKIWVILIQIFSLALICFFFFGIIENIIGVNLTFLMWLTFYFVSITLLVRSLRVNDISEREVTGELSVNNIPWLALLSIKVLLIIFSWISQGAGLSLVSIFYSDIYVEVYTALSNQEALAINFHIIIMLIIRITLAPIFEELLFRGYLLNKLGDSLGIIKAILINSLLFSLLHFDVVVFFAYFVSGIFYSLVYLKTKKIIVPIILHSFTNLISGFTIFLPSLSITSLEQLKQTAILSTGIFIILIPIIGFIFYQYSKRGTNILPHHYNKKSS